MAIRAYNSPGVTVQEISSPAVAPLVAGPSLVAIVGYGRGEQAGSERILLTGTTPVTLTYTGVEQASVVVRQGVTNEILDHGNYILAAGSDPDATVIGDEPLTIKRAPAPAVAPAVSNGGTGTLDGTYVYAISFINNNNAVVGETGIGPASAQVTFNGAQGANLTAIPVDATVGNTTTGRKIYRAKVTGGAVGTFRLVATINDNTTTIFSNENTSDVVAEANASPKTGIATGDTVVVSYDYTNQYYFEPTLFDDFDDVVDKYGDPFDANGAIVSPLSLAAQIAFANGASEIVGVAARANTDADIINAISQLEDEDGIAFVSVASGSTAVISSLNAHVASMNTAGEYRMAVVGRDGSTTAVTSDTLRAAAQATNREDVIYVSPATFIIQNPVTGSEQFVGGQYAAAGVLGMFAARDVQVPLTRKGLAGFRGVGETRSRTAVALDSQAGLFVIYDQGGALTVRHQLTTAVSNVNTAEASVVRAKYEMARRLKSVLDGAIVGQVIPVDEVPLSVTSVVQGVLEQLLVEGAITDYSDIKARVLDTDATTVEVRYQYRPAFPINSVIVRFTINTNTGDFTAI